MDITITPYKNQVKFFESKKRYVAFGGARGGGKSWAARIKMMLIALHNSGVQILLLRRTLRELRGNHIIPFMQLLKGLAEYKSQEKEFVFSNSSRIVLGYCSAEADVLQYQGQAYDVIFLEESTQFTEFQFQALTECNRSSGLCKTNFKPRMYFTCNPGGVGHVWVKRLFIDRKYVNKENPNDYDFIASKVYDNKFLMLNSPDYVRALENLPEDRRKAMLDGNWDVFDGQYFSEFSREVHVIEPFEIPKNWNRYISIDYGLDMLACYFSAIDTENNVYIYKEIYESNLIISDASKKIKSMIGEDENITLMFAPTDLYNRRQDSGKSAIDIFAEHGLFFIKASNDRVQGWYNVKEWIKPVITKDVQSGDEIVTSRLKIFKNCSNLIRCFPQVQYCSKNPNDVASEPHELTHSLDAIRYLLSDRPVQTDAESVSVNNYHDDYNDERGNWFD